MSRRLAALPLLLLLASPAAALTPDGLWAEWQARAAAAGITLAAEVAEGADGALTLRAVTLAEGGGPPAPLPPGTPFDEVTLRPVADGAVAIDLRLPADGTVPLGPAAGGLRVEQRGLSLLAREEGGVIVHEVAAESLRLASLPDEGGGDVLDGAGDFAGELVGLRATFPLAAGPDRRVAATLSAEGLAYVVDGVDPFTFEPSTQTSRTEGRMALSVEVTLPEGMGLPEMDSGAAFVRALDAGFAVALGFETGAVTQASTDTSTLFPFVSEGRSEPGAMTMRLDRSGASLAGDYAGGSLGFESEMLLPVPRIDLSYGAVDFEVTMPFGPGPGDWRYRVALTDVAVGDQGWDAIDPEGVLPRGPARLVLDLGGRAVVDLPALAATGDGLGGPGAGEPVVIESLDVRAAEAALGGVLAAATGAFTFDYAASALPSPVGKAEVRLEGVDRLLDALAAAGLVTAADAGNARLGLGAFFRAGEGPDVRVTSVEAQPGGRVLVNGVQVQ